MNTHIRMTKQRREVLEMMHNGWKLCVRASRNSKGRHKAYLDLQESLLAPSRTVEVNFSVIDALQKAHLIRPVDSRCNQSIWIYDLVNQDSSRELPDNLELQVNKIQDLSKKLLTKGMEGLITSQEAQSLEEGVFEPQNLQDAREKTVASIVRRRGQSVFRKKLLEIYQGRCAITGTNVEPTLEAAHIIPYKGVNTNFPSNGLLLRADVHTLFDLGLLAIDTSKMTVILSEELVCTDYGQFMGIPLRLPVNLCDHPSIQALDLHRKQSDL